MALSEYKTLLTEARAIASRPELAQTWSAPADLRWFWEALRRAGYRDRTHPRVADYCAGAGFFLLPWRGNPRLTLRINDLDERWGPLYEKWYPGASVTSADLRALPDADGSQDLVLLNPPVLDSDVELVADAIAVGAAKLRSGGLLALNAPNGTPLPPSVAERDRATYVLGVHSSIKFDRITAVRV